MNKTNSRTLPGFSPAKTVEIQIVPVQAEYLKVTMVPPGKKVEPLACIDEFEVYAPSAQLPATLPHVAVLDRPEVWRPTRHTTLGGRRPHPCGSRASRKCWNSR